MGRSLENVRCIDHTNTQMYRNSAIRLTSGGLCPQLFYNLYSLLAVEEGLENIVSHLTLNIILYGGFLLYVFATDVDELVNPNDPVDDIFIERQLAVSPSFTSPTTYTGVHNNARLELRFRVQCDAGFRGTDRSIPPVCK